MHFSVNVQLHESELGHKIQKLNALAKTLTSPIQPPVARSGPRPGGSGSASNSAATRA